MTKLNKYKNPFYGLMYEDLTLCKWCGFLSATELVVRDKWHCPICGHDAIDLVPW